MTDDQNAVSYTGREHQHNITHQYRTIPLQNKRKQTPLQKKPLPKTKKTPHNHFLTNGTVSLKLAVWGENAAKNQPQESTTLST